MVGNSLTSRQERRIFGGLAVQPFVAFAIGFASFPVVEFVNRSLNRGRSGDLMDAAIALAAGAAVVAFFVTIFVASPLAVRALKRGRVTFRRALGFGVLLGNLPLAVILVLDLLASSISAPPPSRGSASEPFLALGGLFTLTLASAFGMAGAAVFWLTACREHGDAEAGGSR